RHAPYFSGSPNPDLADRWLRDFEKILDTLEVPHDKWLKLAVAHLSGSAEVWYDTIKSTRGPITTWPAFSDAFLRKFIPIT
ncbi:UNVERIFIED_CONTAM: hypothetical protein ITH36_25715, partial [Salmonella enterica subsp. enterica serovar Weltevreden]